MSGVEYLDWTGPDDAEVRSVVCNAAQAGPGSLFCTWTGARSDGHQFAPAALDQGASVLVVERDVDCPVQIPRIRVASGRRSLARIAANFHGHPAAKLAMLGVTGTNGKTSTAWLIHHVLCDQDTPCGLLGTVEYRSAGRAWPAGRTTPESLDLQRLLADMVDDGCRAAVMEVSSHALVLDRVEGIGFQTAVFTNFTRDHLDFHGTMENYLAAKRRLFEDLRPGATAVLNADCPETAAVAAVLPEGVKRSLFGVSRPADHHATDIETTRDGIAFTWHVGSRRQSVCSPWIGAFHVSNLLAAAAALHAHGLDPEVIAGCLEKVPCVPGRMEVVPHTGPFTVLVDYAHTDDAISKVLETLRPLASGKLRVLAGCGGDRDRSKRPLRARAAVELADEAVFTSDNPRSEDPMAILDEMMTGVRGSDNVRVIPDRGDAIAAVIRSAREGDVILLAGKGHERTQEINGVLHAFSDVERAAACLAEKGGAL